MKPKLILLNGNPGMGKSTLAQRYIDDHPLALNLDIDKVWFMLGKWQQTRPESDVIKYKYAEILAKEHLSSGYDVVVPQQMESSVIYEKFERIAATHNAVFKEFVLLSDPDDVVERLKIRGRAQGYSDGFRPGGILDTSGREEKLKLMYENVMRMTVLRPSIIKIHSVYGQEDRTYQAMLSELGE